jgi:predicted TIM-barrel fold metal-dependent hydrolase
VGRGERPVTGGPARIDAHLHLIPSAYREELERRGLLGFPLPRAELGDVEAMMHRHDIDGAVLAPTPPGVAFGDERLARRLARVVNEELAAAVATAPSRLGAFAILPLPDVDGALDELAHALDVLRLDGVLLLTNVLGTYVGDPAWDPVFAELDRRGAHVMLHPHHPPHPLPLDHPVWLYEYPFETTRAAANLIYSGTLERHTRMTLQLPHLGGTAQYLGHRIASLAAREPGAAAAAPAGALTYLSRLYYDTGLADNALALTAAGHVASPDRLLFGSDWPYAPLPDCGDPQPALDVLGEQRAAVDGANLARLLPRFAAAA